MIDLIIYFKMIFLLIFSIVLHEFGHWFYFKFKIKKNVKIRFEDLSITVGEYENDYIGLSLQQKKDLFWSGIIFGLFPIMFVSIYEPIYVLVLPLYLIGCKSDLFNLKRLCKE
jgi:hypothetical protein